MNPALASDHIGITVRDMSRALAFWTQFLEVEPVWVQRIEGPHLASITGYPGLAITAAWLPLSETLTLELVEYHVDDVVRQPLPPGTARPGMTHLALRTDDVPGQWRRAVDLGAEPISEAPVSIQHGPNAGATAAYLYAPSGGFIELVRPPAR